MNMRGDNMRRKFIVKASQDARNRNVIIEKDYEDGIDEEDEAIMSAESDSGIQEEFDNLKDDFNFILEGFEQLTRLGKDKENEAHAMLLELSGNVANIRSAMAEALM